MRSTQQSPSEAPPEGRDGPIDLSSHITGDTFRRRDLSTIGDDLYLWVCRKFGSQLVGHDKALSEHSPCDPRHLAKIIYRLEVCGVLEPGMRVLELGSGFGNSALMFAAAGYETVGVELNRNMSGLAENKARELAEKGRLQGSVRITNDSFYPQDYLSLREAGKALAPPYERQYEQSLRAGNRDTPESKAAHDRQRQIEFLKLVPGSLTPEFIRGFDVVFAYPWDIQLPSVYELFALYGGSKAVFVCARESRPASLMPYAAQLGLIQVDDCCFARGAERLTLSEGA